MLEFKPIYIKKKNKLEGFSYFIVRVILFPIAFIIRVFRWTYHYDD